MDMKKAVKIGLVLAVLAALLIVSGTGTALAGECMSIGEVSTQCTCDTAGCW